MTDLEAIRAILAALPPCNHRAAFNSADCPRCRAVTALDHLDAQLASVTDDRNKWKAKAYAWQANSEDRRVTAESDAEALAQALSRLAKPLRIPLTEEGSLVQSEVMHIARVALTTRRREPVT